MNFYLKHRTPVIVLYLRSRGVTRLICERIATAIRKQLFNYSVFLVPIIREQINSTAADRRHEFRCHLRLVRNLKSRLDSLLFAAAISVGVREKHCRKTLRKLSSRIMLRAEIGFNTPAARSSSRLCAHNIYLPDNNLRKREEILLSIVSHSALKTTHR